MGYIYKADVYCNTCGDAIRAKLAAVQPEDELDHSSYDSDDYPKDAPVELEEADTPQHCAACGDFLHNPLTADGYKYVEERLNESSFRNAALTLWANYYGFTYWTEEDCSDDGRFTVAGWHSTEA